MTAPVTRAFRNQSLDAAGFGHVDHLRVAYDLLQGADFIDATTEYARGIQFLAARAGAADKFNLTITYAFMSLIAEALARAPAPDFDSFLAANPDLLSPDLLTRWYTPDRLHSPTAREILLMPTPA